MLHKRSTRLFAAISIAVVAWAVALMFPRFITFCYNMQPQEYIDDKRAYLFAWATNGIYVGMLIIAILAGLVAYIQLHFIRSQQETETIFTIYSYLYDDKFKNGKKAVYDNKETLSDDCKIKENIPEIDTLLLMYNNIALLILNNKVQKSSLPTMFYANALKMSVLCDKYISYRRKTDERFGKYYAEHYLKLLPTCEEYLSRLEVKSEKVSNERVEQSR